MHGCKLAVAAIQMSSTAEKSENLDAAETLIRGAASTGAELVMLPELWSCIGLEEVYAENAESIPGPTTEFLAGFARELDIHLLGGSILEREPGEERLFNTSALFDPSGELVAAYRKIHLFDVNVQYQIHKLSSAYIPCPTRWRSIRGALRGGGS